MATPIQLRCGLETSPLACHAGIAMRYLWTLSPTSGDPEEVALRQEIEQFIGGPDAVKPLSLSECEEALLATMIVHRLDAVDFKEAIEQQSVELDSLVCSWSAITDARRRASERHS